MPSKRTASSPKKSSTSEKGSAKKKAATKKAGAAGATKKTAAKKTAAKKTATSKAAAPKKKRGEKPARAKSVSAKGKAYDELCERVRSARAAAWERLGVTESRMFVPLIDPALLWAPMWPTTRQAFRIAKHNGGVLIASDGLSDPCGLPPDERTGYCLEVYLETREAEYEDAEKSWAFHLLVQAAQVMASRGTQSSKESGGFAEFFDEHGEVSAEFCNVPGVPASLVNERGAVGALFNVVDTKVLPSHVELPNGRVRLVSVKLLHLDELAYAVAHEAKGRAELAKRLVKQGDALMSSTARPSVIKQARAKKRGS